LHRAGDVLAGRQLISRNGDAGAVLLEVIVALALLASAGLAAVSMAAEAAEAVSRAREAEVRTAEASRFMDAVSLWTRADLDRRLGERRQGPFILRLDRPDPELYTTALADSASGRVLLATSLFRRDTADALR
jgi:type II secretory pathway pseudopilin PulG